MSEHGKKFTLDDVEALISLIDKTGWRRIIVRGSNIRLILSKDIDLSGIGREGAGAAPLPDADGDDPFAPATVVRAPHLGTISFEGDDDVRVPLVGELVSAGQMVCVLHILDQAKPISSPVAGVLHKRCVADGSLVDYDQPLFAVGPQS